VSGKGYDVDPLVSSLLSFFSELFRPVEELKLLLVWQRQQLCVDIVHRYSAFQKICLYIDYHHIQENPFYLVDFFRGGWKCERGNQIRIPIGSVPYLQRLGGGPVTKS
jgi:hypothetical protein